MAKNIYRKSVLDKLSSPEQLDKMIVITPSSFWIALLGGALIVAVALIWGIFGKLPEKVDVSGMYLSKEETSVISSEVSGIVKNVYVKNGDTVSEGDSLFTIDTESLKEEKEKLEKRLAVVETITLDSDQKTDVANEDTQNLLNIKTQISSSKSNPQFQAYLVALGKYQEAVATTDQCKDYLDSIESLYLEAASKVKTAETSNINSKLQQYQDTINRLQVLVNYYESDPVSDVDYAQAKADYDENPKNEEAKIKFEQMEAARAELLAAQAACASLNLTNMNLSTMEGAKLALDSVKDEYDAYLAEQSINDEYENNTILTELKNEYEAAQNEYSNALSVESSYKSSLASYEASSVSQESTGIAQAKAYAEQFSATKGALIDQLQKEIDKYEKQLTDSVVKAPSAGTVGNLSVSKGQAVQEGAEILSLREGDENDYAVFYVVPSSGYKIHPGMKANIYPSTINRQEYGHINGIVSSVSDYVVTSNEILSKVGDSSLVESIKSNGPVLEITCELVPDESTASGYEWSTKNGANVELAYGTVLSAEIITEEKQPISLLIPYLKEKMENMTTVKED